MHSVFISTLLVIIYQKSHCVHILRQTSHSYKIVAQLYNVYEVLVGDLKTSSYSICCGSRQSLKTCHVAIILGKTRGGYFKQKGYSILPGNYSMVIRVFDDQLFERTIITEDRLILTLSGKDSVTRVLELGNNNAILPRPVMTC